MWRRLGYLVGLFTIVIGLLAASTIIFGLLNRIHLDLPNGFILSSFLVLLCFLMLLVLRYFLLLWFSYMARLENATGTSSLTPMVSIILPAYNEGPMIQASIRSLFGLDYPRFEILVIDDGSSDDTFQRARVFEGDHGRLSVRVIRKKNGGKSTALNLGITAARGELVLCMDADSTLSPGTLRAAVRHFGDPDVAAVAGSVKVVNRTTVLAKLQALEYIEGLNMVRQAQGFFRAVNIIPGPIGIFRRSVLEEIGGYEHDTFAEDCDLTLKLLVRGWKVLYEPGAVAHTEAPEQMLDLLKQRYRWTRGILQAMRKHKGALVDPRRGFVTMATLWYMIFEGIVWPCMNLFGHVIFLLVTFQTGTPVALVVWCGLLTVLDVAAALYCVAAEGESLRLIPYAVHYRLWFALTIDVSKVFATFEELLGLRMEWGKLERMGRI